MGDLHLLSATEAAAAIAARKMSSTELVKACMARIDERDEAVGAWAHLDRQDALQQAARCDEEGTGGVLHGVPVGVKDLIDTKDLPTGYGSPIFNGHRPQRDAACVTLLRRAGAVVLGKTVTTEFAMYQPAGTRNPHDPTRTPGGSSSGSAAAVADFQVPVALGTQTSGSIIRPASYCGAVGYKPSFNTFSPDGIKPLGASLDTLGLFARTVADLSLMRSVLQGAPDARPAGPLRRIGLCRTPYWSAAEDASREALEATARRLEREGFEVEEFILPQAFATINELHAQLMAFEVARNTVFEYEAQRRGQLGERTRQVIEDGWRISPEAYRGMRQNLRDLKAEFSRHFRGFGALIAPAAPGEAPLLAATGDPVFNRMWTLLGVPAISLNVGRGPSGLPVGVQFVGDVDTDLELIELCREAESVLQ